MGLTRSEWIFIATVAAALLVGGYVVLAPSVRDYAYERYVHPERYYTECCDCGYIMGSDYSVPCRGCGSTKRCKP